MRCAVVKAPSIRKEFFVIFAGDKTVKHKRKENMKKILYHCCLAMTALLATLSCSTATGADDVLPNWNDTPLKAQIIDFVENKTLLIPEEDRIAVFDMDGTIACEQPLWFEMAVAVQKMVDKQEADPSLRELTEYQYAVKLSQNPRDTSVLNHWFTGGHNYLESILVSAFEGVDHEEYIAYANDFLNKATVWNGMKYSELFYQPMLELIEYLKANGYEVFIVSGSMQGLVWSICPQASTESISSVPASSWKWVSRKMARPASRSAKVSPPRKTTTTAKASTSTTASADFRSLPSATRSVTSECSV